MMMEEDDTTSSPSPSKIPRLESNSGQENPIASTSDGNQCSCRLCRPTEEDKQKLAAETEEVYQSLVNELTEKVCLPCHDGLVKLGLANCATCGKKDCGTTVNYCHCSTEDAEIMEIVNQFDDTDQSSSFAEEAADDDTSEESGDALSESEDVSDLEVDNEESDSDIFLDLENEECLDDDNDQFAQCFAITTGDSPSGSLASLLSSLKGSNTFPSSFQRKQPAKEESVRKWWEESVQLQDGVNWKFLQHKGPLFAPAYEPLPKTVKFLYNRKPITLSKKAEEVAGFYAKINENEYATKDTFNKNFFKDFKASMTTKEKSLITKFSKCDFTQIHNHYKRKSEERKALPKEEKLRMKEANEAIQNEYGFCDWDGHKEKIGNFRVEPPGLFRGRGDHPKMGMLKKRVFPEDVIINCSEDSQRPVPPEGHEWKEVIHDNTVTWLACWEENVMGKTKYIMLHPSSSVKGRYDWGKYETAIELTKHIQRIRLNYEKDLKANEMIVRQRAVALYLIDRLALRTGNEKDAEDEADTVGCCSLRCEHVRLDEQLEGGKKKNVVTLEFLGKDSIRYFNQVPVDKQVFRNLKLFMEDKEPGDALFDQIDSNKLNDHLNSLMDGLTAKVFRTHNASYNLQNQLLESTPVEGTIDEKLLAYNRANRAVAVLCNHQRTVPKSHDKCMENLGEKIKKKNAKIEEVKNNLKNLSKGSKKHEKTTQNLHRLHEQLKKLELKKVDKEEGKEIALGTSKLNYLDPRISVAWCKKYNVPIDKVYNKTQRQKFQWAIQTTKQDFRFGYC